MMLTRLVLVVVLFTQSVVSLRCYRCQEQYTDDDNLIAEDNSECFEDYTCDDDELYGDEEYEACVTYTEYSAFTGRLAIRKGCYSYHLSDATYDSCQMQKEQLAVEYQCDTEYDIWKCMTCCTGDLCNESGVTMVTHSLSGIVAGIIVSLLLFA
ncbi:uncharacterized protein LOC102805909 [Saccoglossus kowalevskii]|uniref:Uncharacterized protein LOC102805909 n=1 Tax=Saccoglossus kowalevskii TaxID=10224 RepID=A0ABM0MRX9_SACKO|nr:PREDICTED: uncharacterized protein LOC102805909 [Saccoglossus kowalevskii]